MPVSRRTLPLLALLTYASLAVSAPAADRTQTPTHATGSNFIEVFEQLAGAQPGIRKGHARGICASGTFQPSSDAAQRFPSPLFAQAYPVTVRFSMGGGNPLADERSNTPRGIAVQFPANPLHQIAGLSTPLFAGKNPEQFLGLLRLNAAINAGQARADDRTAYFQANPEAARQGAWLAAHPPSTEYTNATYFGVHTFFADTRAGDAIKFRWQLEPRQTPQSLTAEERQTLPAHFLNERLQQRLSHAAATFDWYWIIGQAQDTTSDPSQLWPTDRERIKVGEIVLQQSGGSTCDGINFDPNRLSEGVHASDDPVLRLRSAAYAISFGKRLTGQ